ncbi:MAG TPA: response regulator [Candidatus Saccharimonadales bacterium]|nr:response regulator [Candidatus Saccharimonadales bacterium]
MDEKAHTTPPNDGRKILIIEDELFIGELYARALKKAGYEVTVELDGMKGLSTALTDTFDLILLDLMVPNMLGMDILRHLREEKPDLHSKIVVTTNLDQSKTVRDEVENQADGYLIKAEITPKQLVEFLNSIK